MPRTVTRRHHRQVAPVPAGDDLAGGDRDESHRERTDRPRSRARRARAPKSGRRSGPAATEPASSASGAPLTGSRPVQFGMAVSRKPAIAAITKPNSISWICQVSGSKRLGRAIPVANMMIHSASAIAAQSPAARKNGRNALGEESWCRTDALHLSAAMLIRAPPTGGRGRDARTRDERAATKRGKSGRSFTMKSQAISSAPSAKTTSPGRRIHCQNSVVS